MFDQSCGSPGPDFKSPALTVDVIMNVMLRHERCERSSVCTVSITQSAIVKQTDHSVTLLERRFLRPTQTNLLQFYLALHTVWK